MDGWGWKAKMSSLDINCDTMQKKKKKEILNIYILDLNGIPALLLHIYINENILFSLKAQ